MAKTDPQAFFFKRRAARLSRPESRSSNTMLAKHGSPAPTPPRCRRSVCAPNRCISHFSCRFVRHMHAWVRVGAGVGLPALSTCNSMLLGAFAWRRPRGLPHYLQPLHFLRACRMTCDLVVERRWLPSGMFNVSLPDRSWSQLAGPRPNRGSSRQRRRSLCATEFCKLKQVRGKP